MSVRDKHESATFMADILGRDDPTVYGPFLIVQVDIDVDPSGHFLEIITRPYGTGKLTAVPS